MSVAVFVIVPYLLTDYPNSYDNHSILSSSRKNPPNLNSRSMRYLDEIVLHCTGTKIDAVVTVESVRRYHVNHNKWQDIGYHYLIYRDGSIHVGRPIDVQGAHCEGYNAHSIGIAYVGGLDDDGRGCDTRTREQKAAILRLCRSLLTAFPTIHHITGHREHNATECPCFDVAVVRSIMRSEGYEVA